MFHPEKTAFDQSKSATSTRAFVAAAVGRLANDWITAPLSADAALSGKLTMLRERARDLARNNEWARGFFRSLENNVIGERGVSLQMRVRDPGKDTFDEIANDKIENAWARWGRLGKGTICGRHTWCDVQRLVVRTLACDGEVLIRKIRQASGLKLQVLEADLLDESANFITETGNEVRFGVELDPYRKPVAYWLLARHPGDSSFVSRSKASFRMRVPAEDIIHLFMSERPDQTRGIPWLVASMSGLKMLDGYAEAELVAARAGAAKMGFFTKRVPEGWDGVVDNDGNLSMDATPGTIEELPMGVEFKEWPNDHPNSGYGEFVKSRLRGVATSLGISYNSLASDLENVNYSSIRAGLLEEREVWKAIQRFVIEHLCEDVFTEWLTVELLSGRLGLPFEKLWKFDVPEFQGKRWAWVDPKKDMEAGILGIRSGQTSLRKIIAENGGDIYDVLRSIKADKDLADSLGITLPELTDAPKAPAPVAVIDTMEQ